MHRFIRNGILVLLALLLALSAVGISVADEVVFGDADGDGKLTAQDASYISRYVSRFRMLDAAALSRADYNGDGMVSDLDSSEILNAIMSPNSAVRVTKSFSILVTSDMSGIAWDSSSRTSTAMNVAACVSALRQEDPDLLLFDAGGSLFGSFVADEYRSRTDRRYGPITALFIQMRYDAVLLGSEAFRYSSQTVRHEVSELINRKIPVLGANLQLANPTTFDDPEALWNELIPYSIFEVPQDEGEPMRVAVIGMTDPLLCKSEDEIHPVDLIQTYGKLHKELQGKADYTVLLYYGRAENDAISSDSYPLRDLIRNTDSIDLVLSANGTKRVSVRSEKNYVGNEVQIIALPGGTGSIEKISVSLRENGRPAICVNTIDTSAYTPDESIVKIVRPYVNKLSETMDAVVCSNGQSFEPFEANVLESSDTMELTHEMQLFAAEKWIADNEVDLPHTVVSIAYPYLRVDGLKEGSLTYGDLCSLKPEIPRYSLMIVRGGELRSWLTDYSYKMFGDDQIYSLYGLNYLINTLNPDSPLGYLEYDSGVSVEEDEAFTLIIAEQPDGGSLLRPYLDESWMCYEDRIVSDFELPTAVKVRTIGENAVVDALAAFLENAGTFYLKHLYHWIVL